MDHLKVQQVSFRGEQDGEAERELKQRISNALEPGLGVSTAYLARVSYGGGEEKIAFCANGGTAHTQEIVRRVGAVFNQMFNPSQSLDILFLTPEQEEAISRVAKPFYKGA